MSKHGFFITVCIVSFTVIGLYGPAAVTRADMPTEGLVSYWTFDEGEGDIVYDSVGGNDGVINGAQWTTGFIGTALNFDHVDDYVEIGPGVLPVGEKSFFAWIKIPPVGQSSGSDHDFIIYTASTDATTVWFYFNNGVELRCLNNSSGGFDEHYTAAIDNDQWHHVGFTYVDNTSTLHLYYDGSEVAASTGNDYSTTTNQEAIGGHAQDINNRSWLGKIDEVSIYLSFALF